MISEQTTSPSHHNLLVEYGLPALIVAVFLGVLVAVQAQTEAAAVGLVSVLPIGYAFGAGMIASVNPCGFLMLPALISFHLGTDEAGYYQSAVLPRALKAIGVGVAATSGFVVVFATVGAVITAGGQWLTSYFSHLGTIVGIGMLALGVWLLVTHRTLGLAAATRVHVAPKRNLFNLFLFGVAYAVGSLGCTLPVFLIVVGGAVTSRDAATALGQFVSYSLGMGLVLTAVTLSVALFQGALAGLLRRAIPYLHRTSALFLIGAGLYLIYYWVFFAGFY